MSHSTKFAEMSDAQRNQWVDWANSHDWGSKPAFATEVGNIKVFCAAKDDCGDWYDDSHIATTPADLRGWAGY